MIFKIKKKRFYKNQLLFGSVFRFLFGIKRQELFFSDLRRSVWAAEYTSSSEIDDHKDFS